MLLWRLRPRVNSREEQLSEPPRQTYGLLHFLGLYRSPVPRIPHLDSIRSQDVGRISKPRQFRHGRLSQSNEPAEVMRPGRLNSVVGKYCLEQSFNVLLTVKTDGLRRARPLASRIWTAAQSSLARASHSIMASRV